MTDEVSNVMNQPSTASTASSSAGAGLTVRAIAGSRTIMLAMDATDQGVVSGLCGFAILRVTFREGSSQGESPVWLSCRSLPAATSSPAAKAAEDEQDAATALLDSLAQMSIERADEVAGPSDPLESPIRAFRWSDYTVEPGSTYVYRVYKVGKVSGAAQENAASAIGQPLGSRHLATRRLVHPPVTVRVTAEPESAYFNRGCAGSQAYSRQFGTKLPRDPRSKGEPAPWAWLSRGLEEGLLGFIQRATSGGAGWGLRCAFYEFSYQPVLSALAQAKRAGADVEFLYDAKLPTWHAQRKEWTEHGPCKMNDVAITSVPGLRDVAHRRAKGASAIQHNKFLILMHQGTPVAVWTGSTNITTSGLFGHFNVAHVHEDPGIGAAFLCYYEVLKTDPNPDALKAFNEQTPLPSASSQSVGGSPSGLSPSGLSPSGVSPRGPLDGWIGTHCIFSPRASDQALRFYSDLIRSASQAVFLTAAFGLSATITEGLLHAPPGSLAGVKAGVPISALPEEACHGLGCSHSTPTYVLLDNEGRGASRRFVEAVRGLPHAHVVQGALFEEAGVTGDDQLAEHLTELNEHVKWVHTKFLLIDPLSDCPTVVSGSANFSMASVEKNDENMVVLRGGAEARRLASIFLVEFMRVYDHFRPRDEKAREAREATWAGACGRASSSSPARAGGVAGGGEGQGGGDETGGGARASGWVARHYQAGSKEQVERELFAGLAEQTVGVNSVGNGSPGPPLPPPQQPLSAMSAVEVADVMDRLVEGDAHEKDRLVHELVSREMQARGITADDVDAAQRHMLGLN